MLDPWIIEEILKREEELRREQERNRIEIPLEGPPRSKESGDSPPARPPEEGQRGVMIIDI